MDSKYLVFDVKDGTPEEKGLLIYIESARQLLLASGFPDDEVTAYVAYNFGKKNWEKLYSDIVRRGVKTEIKQLIAASEKKMQREFALHCK